MDGLANEQRAQGAARDRLHDLRNLFAVIASGTHLLNDPLPIDRRSQVLLAMEGAAIRGAEVLTRMLAGLPDEPRHCTLLPERLIALRPLLATVAGSEASLEFLTDLPPAVLQCSSEELDRVVVELVTNARRAIGSSGRIVVRAKVIDGLLWLMIVDNGRGMDGSQLRAALASSAPADGEHGTGLSQVRRFAVALNGSLLVRSRRGRGTAVALVLPVKSLGPSSFGAVHSAAA